MNVRELMTIVQIMNPIINIMPRIMDVREARSGQFTLGQYVEPAQVTITKIMNSIIDIMPQITDARWPGPAYSIWFSMSSRG